MFVSVQSPKSEPFESFRIHFRDSMTSMMMITFDPIFYDEISLNRNQFGSISDRRIVGKKGKKIY